MMKSTAVPLRPTTPDPTIGTASQASGTAPSGPLDKGKAPAIPSRALGMEGLGGPARSGAAHGTSAVRSTAATGALAKLMGNQAKPVVPPQSKGLDVDALLMETARTRAVVNMSSVRRNFRRGLALIGSADPALAARGGAVVKADGYGLKAAEFAKVLVSEGCRDFFVAELSEAVKLRDALKTSRADRNDEVSINVLGGLDMDVNPNWYIDHDVTPVLNSVEQALKWNEVAAQRKEAGLLPANQGLDCILQFDSGMSRTGIGGDDVDRLFQAFEQGKLRHIAPQLMMSHLAEAGNADPATEDPATKERRPGAKTEQQLQNFNAIAARLEAHCPGIQQSLGASSTVFLGGNDLGKSIHKSMVRMGATFHAQAPFEADTNPLEPTLTFTSKLGPVGFYKPGSKVGYGGTYTVGPKGEHLATFPVGYRDILPTPDRWNFRADSASEDVPTVRVRTPDGKLHVCKFAGKPSMDMAEINVDGIPPEQRKEGLEVVLIDDQVTTDQFAAQFGLGASYVQTKIASDRVAIIHKDEDAKPSPMSEPVVTPSPWSKAGHAKRQEEDGATAV